MKIDFFMKANFNLFLQWTRSLTANMQKLKFLEFLQLTYEKSFENKEKHPPSLQKTEK